MDTGADGRRSPCVRDAGATFLAPIYHELTGVVCTGGTPRSHIGIVSREFQVPCVMGAAFADDEPARRRRGRARLLGRRGRRACLSLRSTELKAEANRLIAYHGPISQQLTAERTSLELAAHPGHRLHRRGLRRGLVPLPRDDARDRRRACRPRRSARPAAVPGRGSTPCYLWSIANFWLLGRKVIGDDRPAARTTPSRRPRRPRLLGARGRGVPRRRRHPPGRGHRRGRPPLRRRRDRHAARRRRARRRRACAPRIKRFNATLVNYLFLLYFDTRVGTGDTGPYPLPDGRDAARARLLPAGAERLLVVRRRRATCPTRTSPPRSCSTTSTLRITDFGTANTDARGLPRPPRRLRALHHRHARRRRCARCRSTSSTTSSPSCARRRPRTTATSRR